LFISKVQIHPLIWSKTDKIKNCHDSHHYKTAILKRPYLSNYRAYNGDLGIKRKVLKYATTLSTVEKFIKAIKMHALK
jgi:hypothetical protein